jgi:hypothetical protein
MSSNNNIVRVPVVVDRQAFIKLTIKLPANWRARILLGWKGEEVEVFRATPPVSRDMGLAAKNAQAESEHKAALTLYTSWIDTVSAQSKQEKANLWQKAQAQVASARSA